MSFSSALSSVSGTDDREAPTDDEILARASPMVLPYGLEWSEGSDELDQDGENSSEDGDEVDWITRACWKKAYSTDRRTIVSRWMHEIKWYKNSLRNPSWQPSDEHTGLYKTEPYKIFWASFGLSAEPPAPRPGTDDKTEYVLPKEPLQKLMHDAREHRRERISSIEAKKEEKRERKKRKHSKGWAMVPVDDEGGEGATTELDGQEKAGKLLRRGPESTSSSTEFRRKRDRSGTSASFSVSESRSPGPSSEAGPSSRPMDSLRTSPNKTRRRPSILPESSADEMDTSRSSRDRRNISEDSSSLQGRKKKKSRRRRESSDEEEGNRAATGKKATSVWNALTDETQDPALSASQPSPRILTSSTTTTSSSSTQPLSNPAPLPKPPPLLPNATPTTQPSPAPPLPPPPPTQATLTTKGPPKKSHKYNPQKAPRMKMMDDDIDIDVRRKKRKPTPEPEVKMEIVESPREERRSGGAVGSFATSSNRRAGGPTIQAVGPGVPSSVGMQDMRGGGGIVGHEVRDGRGGAPPSFAPPPLPPSIGRETVPSSSTGLRPSELVSNTSIQDVLDEFDLAPDPVLPSPQAFQIPPAGRPNPRDPRLSVQIPEQLPVTSPSPSTASTSSARPSATTSASVSHPSAGSSLRPTPTPSVEQPPKKPDVVSTLPPEFSPSWFNEIKGSTVAVLRSNEDKKDKSLFKDIIIALRSSSCTIVGIPPPDQPHDHFSFPDVVLGSSHIITPEKLSHFDWIVDMRHEGTRFFSFAPPSSFSSDEEKAEEREMVELGGGGKSLVCFSPEALINGKDTMEALERTLMQNLHLLSRFWSVRMLPEVIPYLQSHAGVRDGAKKRSLQEVATASFLLQAFDRIQYSDSRVLPDFTLTPGSSPQEHDAHTLFQLSLKTPLVDTYDGLLQVCRDISRPGIKDNLDRATRRELQRKQVDPIFANKFRRFIFVTNDRPHPDDRGESWEGVQVMTFAELDQEIRNDLEDLGIDAVPSTWHETREWVETHY
ncbi:hypothetical protein BDY24DRAFT_418257 [Mrakia frigida]|uniref:uncharacterized protein n=1 Tax=Mrakia frigida TaxID=29902 RepID=UPI003FCC1315